MGAAAKKRKTAAQKYHCTSCMTDRAASTFPDYNPTETCGHLINTCKRCLQQWIENQLESTVFAGGVKCPECDELMKRKDVDMAVTRKIFKRYDELERHWIAETTPNWRWCLNPQCRSGQVHESPTTTMKRPPGGQEALEIKKRSNFLGGLVTLYKSTALSASEAQNEKPDIFTCASCGTKTCVPCDRPWHEGEACAEYQKRIKDRVEEEEASRKLVEERSKKCPRSARPIEKNGGCSHMYCTQCRVEFCWQCETIIGTGGRYCKCSPNGPGGHYWPG